MQIKPILQLMELNQLQGASSIDASNLNSTDPSFSMMLEEIMKIASSQNSTNAAGANTPIDSVTNQKQNSTVSSLDNLSLQSQRMEQMLQILSAENMLSNSSGDDIGSIASDDSSNDDIF